MNEHPKGEIERVLGAQVEKKGAAKAKTGPTLLPGTRTIARNPVGLAAP